MGRLQDWGDSGFLLATTCASSYNLPSQFWADRSVRRLLMPKFLCSIFNFLPETCMTVETVSRETLSRRAFLRTSMVSGSTIMLGSVIGTATALAGGPQEMIVRIVVPTEATVLPAFLAAKLQWEYAAGEAPHGITLTVTQQRWPQQPIVHVALPGDVTTYALPLVPNTTYEWTLQPTDAQGQPTVAAGRGRLPRGRSASSRMPTMRKCTRIPASRRGIHRSPYAFRGGGAALALVRCEALRHGAPT